MLRQILKKLKRNRLYRSFRTISSSNESTVTYKGKEMIMLASNNYFGLNNHPDVKKAGIAAIKKYGVGNGASRLVVNLDIQNSLEKAIAAYKHEEAALVFTSGYTANVGIISSLMGEDGIILSDELNHASVIDGCRLSKASVLVYNHCNMTDFEMQLKKVKGKQILVVTDSVFSMVGDVAPLQEMIALKKKYRFKLMIDDAHATGIVDTNFSGVDIHMGTLSKSLGNQGGYVAGSQDLIDFLKNKSRPFFFSTGLNPVNCAGALEALKIIQKDKTLKKKLLSNAAYLRDGLRDLGYTISGDLHILALVLPSIAMTMRFQVELEKLGIFVTGIRPPTVPEPMLRISVMATHTKKDLDQALLAFSKMKTFI